MFKLRPIPAALGLNPAFWGFFTFISNAQFFADCRALAIPSPALRREARVSRRERRRHG